MAREQKDYFCETRGASYSDFPRNTKDGLKMLTKKKHAAREVLSEMAEALESL